MNITINVEAPELASAINALAQALSGNGLTLGDPSVFMEGKEVAEKIKPVTLKAKEEKPAEEKPKAAEKVKEEKPAEDSEEVKEEKSESKPTIELEVVRKKLAALAQDGKQKQVKELLTKFECKKLTEVPAEKYAELLAEAEGL